MNGNISAWAIRNPIPTIVLFLFLSIAGWVSFVQLRINNAPDLDIPAVTVTITQPGAAPATAASTAAVALCAAAAADSAAAGAPDRFWISASGTSHLAL